MQALEFFKTQVTAIREYLPEIDVKLNWQDVTKIAGGLLVGVTIVYCG